MQTPRTTAASLRLTECIVVHGVVALIRVTVHCNSAAVTSLPARRLSRGFSTIRRALVRVLRGHDRCTLTGGGSVPGYSVSQFVRHWTTAGPRVGPPLFPCPKHGNENRGRLPADRETRARAVRDRCART